MLHHQPSPQVRSERHFGGRTETQTSLDSYSDQAQIEDYLDHVCAPLVDVVPYEARRELRAEMRSHLQSMVAAYEELGSTPERAVQEALQQFGRAQDVAREWTREYRITLPSPDPVAARRATVLSLCLFGIPYLADVSKWTGSNWDRWGIGSEALFYRLELFLIPVVAGLAVGLATRSKAPKGVAMALGLMTIPAILFPCFILALGYAGLSDMPSWMWSPLPALNGIVFWMPLGCLAAGLGNWLRQGGPQKLRKFALR